MWYFRNTPIESLEQLPNHEKLVGFCYKITNLKTGAIYIGKKQVISITRKRLTKKEVSSDKRRKTYKIVLKESDWKKYYGSSQQLLEDLQHLGKEYFFREILELAYSKKHLSYLELKYQFIYDVLFTNSYNGNILGRFFTKDVACKT